MMVLLDASPSSAQQAEPITRLPPVVVVAPSPSPQAVPRSWIPNWVDRLSSGEVTAARPSILPDALERLPGATLQNEQGNPFQPTLTLRGFTSSSVTGLPQGVSVFLDGVRLNEPTVEEVNFDLIPLEDIERVEIIRGPSVLFGRNTLGAALSMTTRRGEEIREIAPEIGGGSFGRRQYRLRVSGEARPLDYYLSLNETLEDGFRDDTASRLSRAFGKLGLRAGSTDGTLSYQFSDNRIKQAGSLPESELRRDRTANFTSGDFFAPTLHQGILNVRQSIGEPLTVQVNAFARSMSSEQFNVNLIAPNSRLRNSTLSAGGAIQLTHDDTIFDRRNVLIVGAEYARHDVRSRTFQEDMGAQTLEADLTDVQDAVGLYAQDSFVIVRDVLARGSTIVLTVAGRWDSLRHDIDDRLGGDSGGIHRFDRFNPRVGLNFNVSERLGVYASYGEGFRAPAFLELTCAGPGAICPGLQAGVAPDPTLRPVKTRTYEVGVRARPLTWLEADVSAFRTDVEDDIFSVAPTGTTGVFFQNTGRTRREGIEAGLRARFGSFVEAYLNYAFTRATFQDRVELATPVLPGVESVGPGDSLALVPPHRINIGVAYHPWTWLTLSLDARYVASQFLRGDEVNQQRPLSEYWVADAGATVHVRKLDAFVRLKNVTNNSYETFGTFAVNGREPGNPVQRFLTPAPPINVLAGVQYIF
jgi:iron complex outermembrane receptor protein